MATSLLFTVACSGTGEEEASEVSNDVPAVELTIVPADGGSDVRPDTPVTVTATNGTIEDVQVTQSSAQGEDTESTPEEEGGDGLDAVTGTLNEDGTEWVSDWTLTPGSTVTVVATGKSASGETVEATSEFTTLEATPGQRLELQSNFPVSGDVVGVGMPI
ncbi:Ig-like domain-containing protein, partial [Thermobifida halotolerans]|uniref:Ig-like domain-containing protein n=1 Tax=Thermobifida halotolerans TaxID=483545 RepID=UPI001F231DDB